ncbi:ubiquitin carboxyl-terminal hydrolase 17-like protein D [Drosophila takahashii]|uniref:ubiquitin carboxyl-terminal hydrolase 17-like protein D n=1 Tax=Drosophila takahashii TaxID=29030 RepID=UPI0038994D51
MRPLREKLPLGKKPPRTRGNCTVKRRRLEEEAVIAQLDPESDSDLHLPLHLRDPEAQDKVHAFNRAVNLPFFCRFCAARVKTKGARTNHERACEKNAAAKRGKMARGGLVNSSNTCYMNSVVQALSSSNRFLKELLKARYESDSPPSPSLRLAQSLQEQLRKLFFNERDGDGDGPMELKLDGVFKADNASSSFEPGRQEDASEFLGFLFSQLAALEDDTPVKLSFGGLRSTYNLCQMCSATYSESQHEAFMWFLDCEGSESESVGSMVARAWESESAEFPHQCPACGEEGASCRRIEEILEPPQTLVLVLNRFVVNDLGETRKNDAKFYCDEALELTTPANVVVKYKVYAAVVHRGEAIHNGHYYALISKKEKWKRADDEDVSSTSKEALNRLQPPDSAYILFYRLTKRTDDGGTLAYSEKQIKRY